MLKWVKRKMVWCTIKNRVCTNKNAMYHETLYISLNYIASRVERLKSKVIANIRDLIVHTVHTVHDERYIREYG